MSWLSPARWLVLSGLIAALVLGYGAWARHQQAIGAAPYIAATQAQKIEASQLLAIETEKARAASQALQDFKNQREKIDAENQAIVAGLSVRLRAAGRLRDPNAAGCGGGGAVAKGADPARAADRADDNTEAGGLLSAELDGLLRQQAEAADVINTAYVSCRADSLTLREVLK